MAKTESDIKDVIQFAEILTEIKKQQEQVTHKFEKFKSSLLKSIDSLPVEQKKLYKEKLDKIKKTLIN
jgi:hypothetical protein